MSCKSDTLNRPDDDHKGEDEEDDNTEDDDSHVHIFFSMQKSEVARKVGSRKKFCGKNIKIIKI